VNDLCCHVASKTRLSLHSPALFNLAFSERLLTIEIPSKRVYTTWKAVAIENVEVTASFSLFTSAIY